MWNEYRHISDKDLLSAADGELSTRRLSQIRAHLANCQSCCSRRSEIEEAVLELTFAHHNNLDRQLPLIAEQRALLRIRLAEHSSKQSHSFRHWVLSSGSPLSAAFVCMMVCALILSGALLFEHSHLGWGKAPSISVENRSTPNRRFTPGAARNITISEVCSVSREEVIRDVSLPLRQKVLQEYGITNALPGAYEIDYLIAPKLGGTDDIQNLWPEPYGSQWNASVKDALEERLHEMVCTNKLDLATAQRDIATNWIAAYKKYFNTDQPRYEGWDNGSVSNSRRLVSPSKA